MTMDMERLAKLETHVATLVQFQSDLPNKIDKIFNVLEEIKIAQAGQVPRIKSLEEHKKQNERNSTRIFEWIGKTKGSIMTLKYIYPTIQAFLIGFIFYIIQ